MGLPSAIGASSLCNRVCLLPCGGSSPMYVGFSSYFTIPLPSFVPPPPPSTTTFSDQPPPSTSTFSVQPPSSTTITFSVQSSSNRQAMVLSNLNQTSTNCLRICGHVERPPPEPPPLEKMKVLGYCVFRFAIVIVFVFSCCYVCCVLFFSLIYVKFALMVFVKMLQRCLAEGIHDESKNLIVIAANQLIFSTQEMVPSHVVSLNNFENPDSRYVRPQAKEMIRNWIELKTVVPQPTYHVWKNLAWLLGLSYWFCSILLVSNSFKLIDVQTLVGLVNCIVFRMWLENVLTYVSQCLYSLYLII
ncbi:uncharacterized protein LOC123884839 [Trifolium pratense]|uniref:uncharacterized protein LOC123884839 n=1 Tax=Trifolium pratense TaxID=57577 RepID=UPI001E694FA7|nr:uncharacterized protein LOC123884839 [Trifolium pratense]